MGELGTPLMQRVHRLSSGDRLNGVDEAAFQKVSDPVRVERFRPQCLRRGGDTIRRWQDANVELELHIDPHPVFGDEGLLAGTTNFDAQRPHIDFFDAMQKRQRYATAGDDDALASEAGSY